LKTGSTPVDFLKVIGLFWTDKRLIVGIYIIF
jgi:hypothetical protein